MDYENQRRYGFAGPADFETNSAGERESGNAYGPGQHGIGGARPCSATGPDVIAPYGPIGPDGELLNAQTAPIHEGPYTDWGWGYGASLRGYGPHDDATGMGSGPVSIGGFVPEPMIPPGPPQGFAPEYGPISQPGYSMEYGPAFGPGYGPAYAPAPVPPLGAPPTLQFFGPPPNFGPLQTPPLAPCGFGNPATFAQPPFEQVVGYVIVAAPPYPPQSFGSSAQASAQQSGHAQQSPGQGRHPPFASQESGQAGSVAQEQRPSGAPCVGNRQGAYSGVGPQNYVRSDMRIHEDIRERLTAHGQLDASGPTVSVDHGVVTLNGIVPDRAQKLLAGDIADAVPGVKDVVNHLSVQPERFQHNQSPASTAAAGR